jgi:hypothetical protein
VARAGIFLGGVFSFVPGAEVVLSKILAAGFLVVVFLLRIRALLNSHPTESKARAPPLVEEIQLSVLSTPQLFAHFGNWLTSIAALERR